MGILEFWEALSIETRIDFIRMVMVDYEKYKDQIHQGLPDKLKG